MKNKYPLLLLLIVIILGLVTIKSWPKIKTIDLNEQVYSILIKLNLLRDKTYVSDDLDEYAAQEGFDFEKENEKIISDSMHKLYDKNLAVNTSLKIPTITHHVYFSSKHPKGINSLYIEMLKISLKKLNSLDKNWQHNIWTNNPKLFSSEVRAIKGVKVRQIEEFEGHFLYTTLTTLIKKGDELVGHLAEGSDLFRLMALQKFGGLYMDMDYEIYHPKPLFDLMKKFDFIGVMMCQHFSGQLVTQIFVFFRTPHIPLVINNH
jgi:hypothetical protein